MTPEEINVNRRFAQKQRIAAEAAVRAFAKSARFPIDMLDPEHAAAMQAAVDAVTRVTSCP